MTVAETNQLWDEVAANMDRLQSCPGHAFDLDLTPTHVLGKRFGCTRCGATITSVQKFYYGLGRAHGARAGA
jgi:hypothetical protein